MPTEALYCWIMLRMTAECYVCNSFDLCWTDRTCRYIFIRSLTLSVPLKSPENKIWNRNKQIYLKVKGGWIRLNSLNFTDKIISFWDYETLTTKKIWKLVVVILALFKGPTYNPLYLSLYDDTYLWLYLTRHDSRLTEWYSTCQVNISSLSEAAGLAAGDLLVAVNGEDVESCRHKEAQDTIVRSGNNLTLTVRRSDLSAVKSISTLYIPNLSTEAALSTRPWSLLVVVRPLWWAGVAGSPSRVLETGTRSSIPIEPELPPMLRTSPRSSCPNWGGTRQPTCHLPWWTTRLTVNPLNISRTTTSTKSTLTRIKESDYRLQPSK